MLILSRKINETITIGDDITITVLDINGRQVRIGVNAPKNVAVHRKELYDKIHGKNSDSAESSESEATAEVEHD